jgi:hypothetical protein
MTERYPYSRSARHQQPRKLPGHSIYGDWGLPGLVCAYLNLDKLVRWMPQRTPQTIAFDKICAKPENWSGTNDYGGQRFRKADVTFPGLLVHGMPNPCKLPYRMIDGRRRLEKMRRAGRVDAEFLVFEFEEVQPFIIEVVDPDMSDVR